MNKAMQSSLTQTLPLLADAQSSLWLSSYSQPKLLMSAITSLMADLHEGLGVGARWLVVLHYTIAASLLWVLGLILIHSSHGGFQCVQPLPILMSLKPPSPLLPSAYSDSLQALNSHARRPAGWDWRSKVVGETVYRVKVSGWVVGVRSSPLCG